MKPIRFGLIGEYQSGKSLLTNCLLQRSIATVGGGNATTHTIVNYRYGEEEYVAYVTGENVRRSLPICELHQLDTATDVLVIDVFLKNNILKNFILTDMPGFGANVADNEIARKVLPDIDFAILIASSDKSFGEGADSFRNLRALKEHHIPYYFILNCTKIDRWRCDDEGNIMIAQKDLGMLSFYPPSNYPLEENGINIVNLMWYWYSISDSNDELINRTSNQRAFKEYDITLSIKKELGEVSNFKLINKLFNMENRDFLELKRGIREEIEALKRELCPIGTIQAFAFNRIPEGWLICDGGVLSISLFPDLYAAIGNVFGGNEESNFAIPDLRGRFIRGWNADGEIDPGRVFGSPQEDAMQDHKHGFDSEALLVSNGGRHYHPLWCDENNTVYDVSGLASSDKAKRMCNPTNSGGTGKTDLGPYAGEHNHTLAMVKNPVLNPQCLNSEDIRVSSETRPKNIALLFCIKYK